MPEEKTQPAEKDKAAEKDGKDKAEDKKPAEAKPRPQWQDEQGQPVDQTAVDSLLSDFSKFKCNQYLADDAAENMKQKTPVLALTFKSDKQAYTLSLFDKAKADDTDFPGLSSTQPYAFNVAKSKEESIGKQLDKLFKNEPKAE